MAADNGEILGPAMRALWRERGGSYSTNPRTLELDVGLARVFVDVPDKLRVRARYVLGIGPRFTISRDRLRFIVIEEMKGSLPRPVPERFWKALDQGWLGTDDATVQYGGDV